MSTSNITPLGAVGRGVLAGLVGTAAMTAWQELSAKLQQSEEPSDDDGAAEPQDPWEAASAPAQVARRVIEGVFHRNAPHEWIPALTHGMHWSYGTAWGGVFGLIQGTRGHRPLRTGLAVGAGAWAMSYVQLVPMGLYEPPWEYPPKQLAMDLSYHLVYGTALGTAYAALGRG